MKKLLIAIGMLLVCQWAAAQNLPLMKPIDNRSFAHFERNHLIYPGDSVAMERFFQKMDSVVFLGEGNVNIMHIGGSHVQAGVFTQQFRDNLLSIGTDMIGGQNFVFPFTAGGTNNPSHFMVNSTGEWSYTRNAVSKDTDRRMGLAGAAITTTDPKASVTIISRSRRPSYLTPSFDFNKVTLIGFSQTNNVVPVSSLDGVTLRGQYDESQSAYIFNLPRYSDSIRFFFESMPGEFTLQGVLLENGTSGISVHTVGVNGAKVTSYLKCNDFERDLKLIRPDLVIFGIGINDAADDSFEKQTFKRNYGELIRVIKRVNPDCALLFLSNNDSYKRVKVKRKTRYEVNVNGRIVEEAFLEMGKEHNAAVWDQFDIMGGLRSMQDWEHAGLAQKDKVHFTVEGYKLLGDLLYNALIESYIQHVKSNPKK